MRLVMIDAGGTISAVDRGHGFDGGSLGDEALSSIAEAAPGTTIEIRRIYQGLSEAMKFEDALLVARAVEEACREPLVDGVLVAHGTDAMEETAYLCALIARVAKPVVFTGAQRAPSETGFDGLRNLRDAVLTAARPGADAAGVLMVFGGRILSADRARKIHAQALKAFGPEAAVIGRCEDFAPLPHRQHSAGALACQVPAQTVEIVTLGLSSDGRLLEAATTLLDGIVIQALGCGNASDSVIRAVEAAVKAGRLVGVVSGCFEGVAAPVYASGHRLRAAGALFMKDMDARRARLLMACALGDGRSAAEAADLISSRLDAG
jgi:L-asparaginase